MFETYTTDIPIALVPNRSALWKRIIVTDLESVQNLLDALEDVGFDDRHVVTLNRQSFAVTWR